MFPQDETAVAKVKSHQLGRPVNKMSARQIRIAELEAKRNAPGFKLGRPTNPESPRQLQLKQQAELRAAGLVKRGRPAFKTLEQIIAEENSIPATA